jgi:hypothetical protein
VAKSDSRKVLLSFIPNVKSRPTFIVTALLSVSQTINKLEVARETSWKRSIVMLRRIHQRVFCILPATPTLKFTRTYNILPLPLNTKDLCFCFSDVFEETEDGKLCSTDTAFTEPLLKYDSHQLVKKFPTTCGTERFITVFTTVPSDPSPESHESSPNLHFFFLTFMGPCVVNVCKYNQQDATLHNGIYCCTVHFENSLSIAHQQMH